VAGYQGSQGDSCIPRFCQLPDVHELGWLSVSGVGWRAGAIRKSTYANTRKENRERPEFSKRLVLGFFNRANGFIGHISRAAFHAVVHAVLAG